MNLSPISNRFIYTLLILIFTCPTATHASGLRKIKDGLFLHSEADFATKDGIAYFPGTTDTINTGIDQIYGLWRTDGTEAGTYFIQNNLFPYGSDFADHTSVINVNGTLFYKGKSSNEGVELWKSDGITSELVKDIRPGPDSSFDSGPANFHTLNDTLYFTADDGSTGKELWKSNGTTEGTEIVKDIYPGSQYSSIYLPEVIGNNLVFIANDQSSGEYGGYPNALWKSDGTFAHTSVLRDFNPDLLSNGGSDGIKYIHNVDDNIYVGANYYDSATSSFQSNLFKIDNILGIELLQDFNLSSSYNIDYSDEFVELNGTVYFTIENGLWKTNGTAAETSLVQNFSSSNAPINLTVFDGIIFFLARDKKQLWKTDGSPEGAELVYEFTPHIDSSYQHKTSIVKAEGKLFISIPKNNSCSDCIQEGKTDNYCLTSSVWESDGTPEGTIPLNTSDTIQFFSQKSANDKLYVSDSSGLWVYDSNIVPPVVTAVNPTYKDSITWSWRSGGGTGAYRLKVNDSNLDSGAVVSTLSNYTSDFPLVAGDYTLFIQEQKEDGTWTETASYKVQKLDCGPSDKRFKVLKIHDKLTNDQLVELGENLFFVSANDSLYKFDYTSGDTSLVKSFDTINSITKYNGVILLNANDGITGAELWKSDGTTEGTVLLKDINPGIYGSNPSYFTASNGQVLFNANDGTSGAELWATNGTTTQLVKDINQNGNSFPINLTNINDVLYFQAFDDSSGAELWKSNGTTEGTVLVKDINPGPYVYCNYSDCNGGSHPGSYGGFIELGGAIYFQAQDDSSGVELWKTDGSAQNTELVKDIYPGTTTTGGWFSRTYNNGSYPHEYSVVNGKLFFSANENTNGRELWQTDGTFEGTTLFKDINPGTGSSHLSQLFPVNDVYLFRATNGYENEGTELWVTDGTSANTSLLKDINPGYADSTPYYFTRIENTVLFTAEDGIWGRELWGSNGTASGTKMVRDLLPGPDSSNPTSIKSISNKIYISSADGLWLVEQVAYPPTVTGETPIRHLSPTWTWTSGEGGNGTFRFKLDDNDLTTGASTVTTTSFTPSTALTPGLHTLYVQEQNDQGLWSESGSFTINLVNNSPVAQDSNGQADSDTSITFILNGSDPENDPLTYKIIEGPDHGRVIITGSNAIYYPDPGFSGNDTFSYAANDGELDSSPAIVTVTITPVSALTASISLESGQHTLFTPRRIEVDELTLAGSAEMVSSEKFSLQAGVQLSDGDSVDYTVPFPGGNSIARIRYKSTTTTDSSELVIFVNGTEQERIPLTGVNELLHFARSSIFSIAANNVITFQLVAGSGADSVILDYIDLFPSEQAAPALTISQTVGQTVLTGEQINIMIPAGVFAKWDPAVATVTVSGDAATKISANITYSSDNKTLNLTVLSDLVAGDVIQLSGLQYKAVDISSEPGRLSLALNSDWQYQNYDSKIISIPLSDLRFGTKSLTVDQPEKIGPITIQDSIPALVTMEKGLKLVIPDDLPVLWDDSVTSLQISGSGKNRLSSGISYSSDKKELILNINENLYFADYLKLSGAKAVASQDHLFHELIVKDSSGYVLAVEE